MKEKFSSPKAIILATIFLDVIGIGLIIPVLPLYVESFGVSHHVVTALFAVFALCSFFSAPILGVISDRKGRRPVLLASLFSSAVGWLIFAFSHSVVGLFIGRIVDGIAAGNISTAQNYLIDIAENEKERTHNLGLIGAVFGIAFIIGPLVGGLLSEIYMALPFIVVGILSSINTVLAYFLLPETHHHRNPEKISWNPFAPITKALMSKSHALLYFIWFLFGIAITTNQSIFALYVNEVFGWGVLATGLMMAGIGVVISLNQAFLIKRFWLHYFTPKFLNLWLLIPFAIGYFIMGIQYQVFFLLGLLITAFGHSVYRVTMTGQMVEHTSKHEQGEMMGVLMSLMSLSMIVGPIAGGFVYTFHLGAPYWLAGAILVVVFALFAPRQLPLIRNERATKHGEELVDLNINV